MNIEKQNGGSNFLNFLLWIFLLFLLIVPGYFFYNTFVKDTIPDNTDTEEKINENSEDTETEEDTSYTYNEESVEGEVFFEKFPVLEDNQQAYISIPLQIDTLNPPSIVIYNHGELETVDDSVNSDFMCKLRKYSKVFTENNYVFSASYIHDNDGINSSNDINNLIKWISDNYTVSPNIYLIGFSRGGYTTTKYLLEYPDNIKAVALLAPATYYTEWDQNDTDIVMDIPIKIWHGTDDVNIGIIHTYYFIERLAEYGKTIDLAEKEGKTHYDVDDEYIDEILDFFNSTLQ